MYKIAVIVLSIYVAVAGFLLLDRYVFHLGIFAKPAEEYLACGCGCCPSSTPKTVCLYKDNGDDLQSKIDDDILAQNSSLCSKVGCSQGTLYKYCQ